MKHSRYGKWLMLAGILGVFIASVSQAETRIGGMTVREAFADDRVARLIDAVGRGAFDEADRALKDGADVNMVGKDAISPLLWVLGTHDAAGMEYLLKAGADPNYRDAKEKFSAMSLTAGGDRPNLLELLLKHRGNPNLLGPKDETLLQVAIGQLRDKNVDLLLKYGADINGQTRWGTAAQTAAAAGRFDLVVKFLEQGLTADLQRLARVVEIRRVPANSAQQRSKDKVVELLKARGVTYTAIPPVKSGPAVSPNSP